MNVIPVLCRLGNVDMGEWRQISSITSDTISYNLYTAVGRVMLEAQRYLVEVVVDDVVVRRGRLGALQTMMRGVSYEFNKPTSDATDVVLQWFNQLRNHYYGSGDDWFTIAFAIGEGFYMRDVERAAASCFESEQAAILFNQQQDFTLNFSGLKFTNPEDDIKLDDIWTNWSSDDGEDLTRNSD